MDSSLTDKPHQHRSQFALFRTRRFAPFFLTQFLGAFNDNLFKQFIILLLTYQAASVGISGDSSGSFIFLAQGLLILPFFLFSSTAGQLADKYEKSVIIRRLKTIEIGLMCFAAWAFWQNSLVALLALIFLMGTQSAFFGPIKYSILPQHLYDDELVGGNAQVEMGTFVAILLGTIISIFLFQAENNTLLIAIAVIGVAVLGRLASQRIPHAQAENPDLRIERNPLKSAATILRQSREVESVFLCIMGISWFWLLGSIYLSQLAPLAKDFLHSTEAVVSLLTCCLPIGIAIGAWTCERLSGRKLELGIVPIGSLGLSLFGIDLYFAVQWPPVAEPRDVATFLSEPGAYRIMFDLFMLGVFGGIYTVPLYTLVQTRTADDRRARIIAALNIWNALFIVSGSFISIALLQLAGLTLPELFLTFAIMNIVVAAFIYKLLPEFAMRFIVWVLSHTMYRVNHKDLDHIPDEGPALLVCNHVSYVDALLIAGACRRPIRFVMDSNIYRMPVLNFVFRIGRTIPITSPKKDPDTYEQAFRDIADALAEGEVVCIFPEGRLTQTGEINEFRKGMERIVAESPVGVVPLALRGLWGSYFSHKDGHALTTWPKRFWSKVELVAGAPVAPDSANAPLLQQQVTALRGGMA